MSPVDFVCKKYSVNDKLFSTACILNQFQFTFRETLVDFVSNCTIFEVFFSIIFISNLFILKLIQGFGKNFQTDLNSSILCPGETIKHWTGHVSTVDYCSLRLRSITVDYDNSSTVGQFDLLQLTIVLDFNNTNLKKICLIRFQDGDLHPGLTMCLYIVVYVGFWFVFFFKFIVRPFHQFGLLEHDHVVGKLLHFLCVSRVKQSREFPQMHSESSVRS